MNIIGTCRIINRHKFFVNLNNRNELLTKLRQTLMVKQSKSPVSFFYLYIGSVNFMFADKHYLRALKNSNYVYLDGFLIKLVIRWLYDTNPDIFPPDYYFKELMKICSKNKKKVFLLGSNPEKGLDKALANLKREYPLLAVDGHHGYFKNSNLVINRIRNFETDLLVVGLGLGYQEKWIEQNREHLKKVKAILTVGNYIEILAGSDHLPPTWITKSKLRWFYRIIKDPFRLWKRYCLGVLFFLITTFYIKLISSKNR